MATPSAPRRPIPYALENGELRPEDALPLLARDAHEAPTFGQRVEALRTIGALCGRAFRASWEVAERAAFVLLEVAREADSPVERAALLGAMGLGFRNVWLMPYVHARLSDEDPSVVRAAVSAAGGLAFPALEEAIASQFLADGVDPETRLAAIEALGRMGAESAAARLAPFVAGGAREAAAALAALTEIRSRAGTREALDVLARDAPHEVHVAAVRYLAEIGEAGALAAARRLARDAEADVRIGARQAWRALEAEKERDPDERILAALTEPDRAVRAALARRLRTLSVGDVLAHAEVLLRDDPEGVVQVVAEVRAPEVTRLLLRLAEDAALDVLVRARAAGSIEADEEWERDALVALVRASLEPSVRAAAAQNIGAFASPAFVLEHLSRLQADPSPAVRAALLWAVQLSSPRGRLSGGDRTRAEAVVKHGLRDADPSVRRRAAYVAGNIDARSLVDDLAKLVRDEPSRPDLRVAAFVALAEIGSPARLSDLVFLWSGEDDPDAMAAASRAIERAMGAPPPSAQAPASAQQAAPASSSASLSRMGDRLRKLLASPNARVRAAAARVAGLAGGAVTHDLLAAALDDAAPRVREQAATALGRLGGAPSQAPLERALGDADPSVQERAAEALLSLGIPAATAHVLDFVSRTIDQAAALRVAGRVSLAGGDRGSLLAALDAALGRIGHEHPVYESLVALKVAALEEAMPASARGRSVEDSIRAAFPSWARLSAVRGFEPLARSLRTAEMLHASSAGPEADHSAPIVLWMKCLEGYLHAWLSPRLRALQQEPRVLWEVADRALGPTWPTYQRHLSERWPDPVQVGSMSVEVPLRSVVNVLRDFQQRRPKSLDSPVSVTEWSRLMLFLALEHPAGPRNLLKVACKDSERVVRLAHRLQVLAQVRNAATHRQVAGEKTLDEFRHAYYRAFEDLTGMA